MNKITLDIKNHTKKYEVNPSKIICLGLNYAAHAAEGNREPPKEPILFPKSPNVLIGPNENIIYPEFLENSEFDRVDYEGELAVIIGKRCKNSTKEKSIDFMDYVYGYTCFNDVTARLLQKNDINNKLPWYRSKSLDTFGPIGPSVVLKEDIKDPNNLNLETRVNGKIMQSVNTKEMIFKIPFLIEYISKYFTLEPGDIISTGTPSGIGPLKRNDLVEIDIESIGVLKNKII